MEFWPHVRLRGGDFCHQNRHSKVRGKAMKGYIAVTDNDWFALLVEQPEIEEVNFWQPGGEVDSVNWTRENPSS